MAECMGYKCQGFLVDISGWLRFLLRFRLNTSACLLMGAAEVNVALTWK